MMASAWVFSRSIPALVRDMMRPVTDAFLAAQGLAQADVQGLIVHPGGERVLEALEDSYGLARGGLVEGARCAGRPRAICRRSPCSRSCAGLWPGPQKGAHLMAALGPDFRSACALLDLL